MAFWMHTMGLVITLLSLAIVFVKHRFLYWKRRGIPHDKPSFPGGNIKHNCHVSENIRQNYQKFKETGAFGGFFLNLRPSVIIFDPDLIKKILVKDFHNFPDRGLFHNARDDPLSGNLFRSDELEWKTARSQLSPSFSGIRMKDMFVTIVTVGEGLMRAFDKIAEISSIVDIDEIVARYVTDVNGTCIFGLNCKSLTDKDPEFFRVARSMSGQKLHSNIVNGLISSFPELARKLGMRETHMDVHNFFLRIVRETVSYREKNSVKRNDFLNLMIDMKKVDDSWTLEKIVGHTFAFFYAGFENSTAVIIFVLYELALNQDIQDKVRSEISTQLEKYGEQLTFDCMMQMRYLKKVAKECLRKYPAIPYLMRLTKKDYKTSHPKYTIPSGTYVIIPIEAIQNDPDIYPDPETFDPERFNKEAIQQRHTTAWLPFGDGPRHCIGLRYAKMQIYVPLILLLRNYRFLSCSTTASHLKRDSAKKFLGPKGNVYLRVDRI